MNTNLVSELVRQKKYGEAINLCNEILDKDPVNAYAMADKAYVFAMQKLYEDALEWIESALSIVEEPAFYFNKARWLINKNDYKAVPIVLEKGIALDRKFLGSNYTPMMYLFKAYAEMKIGKYKDCSDSLSQIDDDISVWIETQMWAKKNILNIIGQ